MYDMYTVRYVPNSCNEKFQLKGLGPSNPKMEVSTWMSLEGVVQSNHWPLGT